MTRPIRGWIRDLELSGPHHVFFYSISLSSLPGLCRALDNSTV